MQLSLFDLHCDTACEMHARKQPLRENSLAVSLNKAKKFEQYIQVMAFWTDHRLNDEAGWERLLELHRNLLSDEAVTCGDAAVCTGCPPRQPGNSLLMSVEDARILNGDLTRVDRLREMGIRILTPLWGGETCIGGSHDTSAGLTGFGRAALTRALECGMILDISHASERSADEIFLISEQAHRPVIASHSNAYGVCPVSRNLRDGQLRAVLASGGVVGLNLFRHFLSQGDACMDDVVRHAEYFFERGAEHALCLGCDMDGAELPPDLPDLSALPRLAEHLTRYYPEDLVRSVFFDNAYHFAERNLQPLSAENP